MEGMELICFEIISVAGNARSLFIEAIYEARAGNIEKAKELVEEGNKNFIEAHKVHAKLIQSEASGNKTEVSLLLVHAEDQLMSAEAFGVLVEEFIYIYQKIN